MLFTLVPLLLAAVPSLAQDIVYNSIHNATTIVGTWATGSKQVVTGSGFANPVNTSFTYPPVTGESYSFTEDGFFEVARYRFKSNGSEPTCIVGTMIWFHGTYSLNPNGSMTLTPFGDGYQQVQDPCAAVSNFIQSYNYTELYSQWRIFMDNTDGPKLHLYKEDGTPVAPQFLVSQEPNMLPTRSLRNVTVAANVVTKREVLKKRSAGEHSWSPMSISAMAVSLLTVGVASMAL